jgi:hypothetical protein
MAPIHSLLTNSMKHFLLAAVLVAGLTTHSSAQCVNLFSDGFESGAFSPTWVPGTGNYTNTVPMGSAPAGSYHLSMQSNTANSFYQGLSTTFTAGQPGYMSWWMRTNTTSAANGYVVIGDGNIASDNGVLFCYFNATSSLRFFNTAGYNHPITANTWYFVECRNVNWTSRTMDIYVNNVLILTGWGFRSPSATSIDRIHLHSLSVATAEYDNFTIGNPAVTAAMSFTAPTCFGGTNGSATVAGGGGTGALTYSWAPSGNTGTTESNLGAGTYSVTVTDAIGCTTVGTVTVTQPTAVTATTTQTNVSCFGGSNGDAMVMPSGGTPGYTYLWSNGGTTATVSGLTAGPLTCTITDVNGCTAVQSVTITEPSALMTGAANNGNVCPGDTAMLIGTATGGTMAYTYTWMPGNMNGSVVSDIPSATTTYTLQVTDANGCTSTSTTTVTVYSAPVVSLGADVTSCASAVLDAQNAGNTYLWSEGSTTQMITVTVSGPYDVVVTDANGCMGMDTINVTINANPVVVGSAAMNFVCTGEPTVQLFESPAGGTWVGAGIFGSTFEPDTAGVGTHDLVYSFTDSLGCTGADTITIIVDLCLGATPVSDLQTPVSVYPNPTNGILEIVFGEEASDVLIEITDVEGRLIYTSKERSFTNGSRRQIDLSAHANGTYFIHMTATNINSVHRITVQH